MIYKPQYDWIKTPMSPFVAVTVTILGIYFLLKTYAIKNSKRVINRAHKKYVAHRNMWAVIMHGADRCCTIRLIGLDSGRSGIIIGDSLRVCCMLFPAETVDHKDSSCSRTQQYLHRVAIYPIVLRFL